VTADNPDELGRVATPGQAAEALRQSEERFRLVFEHGSLGMCMLGADFHFLRANAAFCRVVGRVESELKTLTFPAITHPEDLEENLQEIGRLRAGEIPQYRTEKRYLRNNQEIIWASVIVNLIRDEQGAFLYYLVLVEDITGRKRVEEALRESENKHKALIETTQTGFVILDLHGRVIDANQEYVRLTGRQRLDEILGRSVLEWTAPQALARNAEEVKKCLAQGFVHNLEVEYIGRDGWITPVEINATAVRRSGSTVILTLCRDITQRRRAEAQLHLQAMLLDQIADTVTATDLEGRITFVNEAQCRALQRTREELLGRPVQIYGEDAAQGATQNQIIEATRAQGSWRGEVINRDRQGREFVIDCRTTLVRDEGGWPIGMCGVGTDITERKRAQERLNVYAAQLQALSRQLVEAQENERRHLARELHDEIGQDLTAVQIHLKATIGEQGVTPVSGRLEKALQLVCDLIQKTQDLSFSLRPSVLDDLGLEAALRSFTHQQAERGGLRAEFWANLCGRRLESVIETACFRVAQEALTNVVRHARAREVTVNLQCDQDWLHLVVHDDGVGFDVPAVLGEPGRKGSLGLLGMQERLLLLGGRFECRSSPEQGTEVHGWFPVRWCEEDRGPVGQSPPAKPEDLQQAP
jgi:PAS domain S-box-containing protein